MIPLQRAALAVAAAMVVGTIFFLWSDNSTADMGRPLADVISRSPAAPPANTVRIDPIQPIAASRFVETEAEHSSASSSAASRPSDPPWTPPFPWREKSIDDIADSFATVPEDFGGWLLSMFNPWAVGWENLYSFAESDFSQAADDFVAAFHEELVSERRKSPERSNPATADWPFFSEWLKTSIKAYSRLRRREMYAISAAEGKVPLEPSLGDPKELRHAIRSSADDVRTTIRAGIDSFLRFK